jgi:hypothetical protein
MSITDTLNDALWSKIAWLPRELKDIIGTYSYQVYAQKKCIRREFFRQFMIDNMDRNLRLVSKWTKNQITWFMKMCNYFSYSSFFSRKNELVLQIKERFTTGCEKHLSLFHTRKAWQRFRIIEHIDKTYKTRKSLVLKQRKVEKRQQEE